MLFIYRTAKMANIILQGLTTDQLAEMLREIVRDEIGHPKSHKSDPESEFLSRKEVLVLLGIDSSTLWSWEKASYIHSFPFGGRKRYKRTDIETIRTGKRSSETASPHNRRQR